MAQQGLRVVIPENLLLSLCQIHQHLPQNLQQAPHRDLQAAQADKLILSLLPALPVRLRVHLVVVQELHKSLQRRIRNLLVIIRSITVNLSNMLSLRLKAQVIILALSRTGRLAILNLNQVVSIPGLNQNQHQHVPIIHRAGNHHLPTVLQAIAGRIVHQINQVAKAILHHPDHQVAEAAQQVAQVEVHVLLVAARVPLVAAHVPQVVEEDKSRNDPFNKLKLKIIVIYEKDKTDKHTII